MVEKGKNDGCNIVYDLKALKTIGDFGRTFALLALLKLSFNPNCMKYSINLLIK